MPGIGVLLTSSMAGKLGRRSPRFLRMAASSAHAEVASTADNTTNTLRTNDMPGPFTASSLERLRGQPTFGRGGTIDETHAAVAKFPHPGLFRRKTVYQCIGQP